MSDTSATYTSIEEHGHRHSQAWLVWTVTTVAVLVWVTAIVAAPLLRSAEIDLLYEPLYRFFSYICHQIPERSLHMLDHQMGVCSRCFGVYFGLLAGLAVYPLWRGVDEIEPVPRVWLFLSVIPIAVDWSLTVFGIWENTHVTRFLTGLILGAACAVYIVPALVEVTRNVSYRRSRQ